MVYSIDELTAGDYNVRIKIKNKLDTTIVFKIEKIECPVIMETHFTPNGDNYNDEWDIYNTQFFPDFELFVFNKWGQQVMKQKGTYTKWDGKMGSVDVTDGTYYYVFYYKSGDSKHLKGDVTILR
jgi:gliding motility-associated-like protein